MRILANIVSVVFHPSFLPTWMVAVLLYFVEHDLRIKEEDGMKLVLLGSFFFFTCFLPVINVLVLKRMGYISSLEMEDRKERTMPYTVGLVYYGGLFYLLSSTGIPLFYKALAISGFILILATLIINLKWKISAHMIGGGGLVGAFLMYSLLYQQNLLFFLCLAVMIAALLAFSRLYLKKHSPQQVYAGFLSGLVLCSFSILLSCLILVNLSYV